MIEDEAGDPIPYEDKKFKFALYNSDSEGTAIGEPIETALANGTTGIFMFHSINYTQADVPLNQTREFYYLIQEVIPANAVNSHGVRYEDATPEQIAADGFKKDGIVYNASPILVKVTAVNTPKDGSRSA